MGGGRIILKNCHAGIKTSFVKDPLRIELCMLAVSPLTEPSPGSSGTKTRLMILVDLWRVVGGGEMGELWLCTGVIGFNVSSSVLPLSCSTNSAFSSTGDMTSSP